MQFNIRKIQRNMIRAVKQVAALKIIVHWIILMDCYQKYFETLENARDFHV